MLDAEAFHPLRPVRAALLRRFFFCQYQAVRGMGAFRQSGLAAGFEFFQGVFADRFQHREARFTLRVFNLMGQTLVYHRRHTVEQVQIKIGLRVAYRFRPFEGASAHKYRQPTEKLLLGGVQQVVTPIDGCSKGLLALRHVPRTAGQ